MSVQSRGSHQHSQMNWVWEDRKEGKQAGRPPELTRQRQAGVMWYVMLTVCAGAQQLILSTRTCSL
jgi:hypothetical protein